MSRRFRDVVECETTPNRHGNVTTLLHPNGTRIAATHTGFLAVAGRLVVTARAGAAA